MISSSLPATVVTAVPSDDSDSDDNSDDNQIPTIQLSSRAEVQAYAVSANNGQSHNYTPSSLTVAEQIPTSVRDADLMEGLSTRLSGYATLRAEFVSTTFLKPTANTFLGLQLDEKYDKTIIAIAPHGPVQESPLRVGDKLLSVNHKDISRMTSVEVCRLLKECTGSVTLVAHNVGGASDVVESMITKLRQDDVAGVGLILNHEGSMIIAFLNRGQDIVDSLLNAGDEILSINGVSCEHLTIAQARAIIQAAPKTVSIKAITLNETGVVVAELSTQFGDDHGSVIMGQPSPGGGASSSNSPARHRYEHLFHGLDPPSPFTNQQIDDPLYSQTAAASSQQTTTVGSYTAI